MNETDNTSNTIPILPYTQEVDKKWSFSHPFNLKIVRDVFLYVNLQKKVSKEQLYHTMGEGLIAPPKDKWENPKAKTSREKDRLKLDYEQMARYLDLIQDFKEIDKKELYFKPDFTKFEKQKTTITSINSNRKFLQAGTSPPFTPPEAQAMLSIVFTHPRAKDFLYWFLDFQKFPNPNSFTLDDFRKEAQALFLIKDYKEGKKGIEIVKRQLDNKLWKVPFKEKKINGEVVKSDDYSRMVAFVFPTWFSQLHLVERLYMFRELTNSEHTWEALVPIKNTMVNIEDFSQFINEEIIHPHKRRNEIWIPELIFKAVLHFYTTIDVIKSLIIDLHQKNVSKYILERTSLAIMKHKKAIEKKDSIAKNMFIKYDGYYSSYFTIINT